MSELREKLQHEIDSGGPGKTWFEVFHERVITIAGKWNPKDFVDHEPDALNPATWKFAKKMDLTQKLFEEEILVPKRGVIPFILSASTDSHVRANVCDVVNQFLNETTKGADDKRAFKLILERFSSIGFSLVPPEGSGKQIPTTLSDHETTEHIKRILMSSRDRLPNAFLPAGEEERNSPIWTPTGYDKISNLIASLPGPITENALRMGISEALTVLRLALYYTDDTPEDAFSDEKLVPAGEGGEMVNTAEGFKPLESLLGIEESELADKIMRKISPKSRNFLKCVNKSKNKVKLAMELGVSRGTALKMEKTLVTEVNQAFDEFGVPDQDRQSIRRLLLDIAGDGEVLGHE
ncbi:hypothetical protein MCERE155_00466 [Candidatus Nanopelagicaceae bacterium]